MSSLPLLVPKSHTSNSISSTFSTLSSSHLVAVYNFCEFIQDGYFDPTFVNKETTECVLQYDDPYNRPNSAKRPLFIPIDTPFAPF